MTNPSNQPEQACQHCGSVGPVECECAGFAIDFPQTAYDEALDNALAALPEQIGRDHSNWALGWNYALDQARANIEKLKGGASQ